MNPVVKRIVTALSTAAAAVLAIIYAPTSWFFPAFGILLAVAFVEYALLLRKKRGLGFLARVVILVGGLVVLCGLLALPATAMKYGNLMMLYVVGVIKISDMGGFALGKATASLMKGGNHKMCPTISPNKSWEGLFGSVLASCILSCLFMSVTHFGWSKSLALGVTAALVGTAGDLVESKFKRWVGVKDSAAFMPAGLGGFLDMFDSLLLAPAVLLPLL